MSFAASRTGLGRYAYQGRHRTPDTTGTAVRTAALGAGVVAAVMVGSAAPASAAPSSDPWYRLRVCESGNNYKIDTGNGYYGAYQFNLGTWRAYGGKGYPHQASPAEQDHRAKLLYQARGWSPWPACSRKLGLRNDPAYGRTGPTPAPAAEPVVRATTLRAPAILNRGTTMKLRGTAAAPRARVTIYMRYVAEKRYRVLRTVRASATGAWATRTRPMGSAVYYAVAAGKRSGTAVTRVRYVATLSGPSAVRLGSDYRIGGTARPNSSVMVKLKPGHASRWQYSSTRRVDRKGRWSMVLRGTNDYRYVVVGETRSAARTTRIATTAAVSAPATSRLAGGGSRVVTVSGTARPHSRMILFVKTPTGQFRTWRKFATTGSGRWALRLDAPGSSFRYYAKSSNGLRSTIRSMAL